MAAVLTGPYGGAEESESQYPLLGETLGLWRLLRGIGRGGMGEVYEAEYDFIHLLSMRHEASQRGIIRKELHALPRSEQARLASELLGMNLQPDARFALKLCNARVGTAGFKRFIQEAELARRLGTHPHIVTVHYIHNCELEPSHASGQFDLGQGRHADVAYMVMDLALRSYDVTRLALEEAVTMVRAIATALDHAHAHGVVHRDLKPENILGSVSEPLLTDFGIAKEVDQTLGLTRTGQIIGTLDYMSPEQATDAKHVDHRSDIYSLGVVLYEFATRGCLPYYHISEREACLAAIRSERTEPRWPRLYDPRFPKGLEYIILKALSHRRDDRYQQMSEFIGDLDRFTRGDWINPFQRVPLRRFFWHGRAQHPRLVYGAPIVLVVTLLLVVVFAAQHYLDPVRSRLQRSVAQLEEKVKLIDGRQYQQFTAEEEELVASLRRSFEELSAPDQYPGLKERFRELMARYQDLRFLNAEFMGGAPQQAADQLERAIVGERPAWVLSDIGLQFHENSRLEFESHGDGAAHVRLHVEADRPVQMTIHAEGDSSRRCVVRASSSGVRLDYERGESDERNCVFIPFRSRGRYSVDVLVSLSGETIQSYWPNEVQHTTEDVPVLDAGEPARVSLDLPEGAVLKTFGIWP